MMRHAPISTLFPYTTLFRSDVEQHHVGPELAGQGQGRAAVGGGANAAVDAGDRKSTRLNSSHLGISYAVFCLKKKKPHRHRTPLLRPEGSSDGGLPKDDVSP